MNHDLKKVTVSIIMPAYNASNYIEEAINSVIAQSYTNWELIIVDDGSTDNTAKIVKEYVYIDNRIKYYYQENKKQGKARNLGILNSSGLYLAFLDSDDFWESDKLEYQLQQIMEKEVDLVFSDSYVFNDNSNDNKKMKMNIGSSLLKGTNSLEKFLQGNRIPILTVLVKKEKIILVDCFSEKLSIQNAEDYHLWIKLLINECVFYGSKKVLASYRLHERGSTNKDKTANEQVLEAFFDLREQYPNFNYIFNKAIKNNFRNKYQNNLFSKSDLNKIIDSNFKYLEKSSVLVFYKILNILLPTKITKKFLIHFLNG